MKERLFFLVLLLFIAQFSKSQTRHFVFIQTEDNQLFYVKANGKIFSSTSLGSVIVPNLEEGEFIINIGFPQNRWNTLKYKLNIKNRDLAYVLKKTNSEGWSLYDYYSMSLIESLDTARAANKVFTPVNDFARLLSQVSGVNMELSSASEYNSKTVAEDTAVSESVQVLLSKNQIENATQKKNSSQADSALALQINLNKEEDSNLIKQPSAKDSIISLSKKKDNFVSPDSSISKTDSVGHVSVPSYVKLDSTLNKITSQNDSVAKQENKEKQVDSSFHSLFIAKSKDTIVLNDTIALISTEIVNSKNDVTLTENLPNQQFGLAPDSIAVILEFRFEDSLSRVEKSQLKADAIRQKKESVIIKDSFDLKSKHTDKDIKADTLKANLIQDSLMSLTQTMTNDSVILSVDSINKRKAKVELDTVKTKLKCMSIANDKDFIQLRRSMTNEEDESKMISAALMMFKEKCFTTLQIKNLVVLFLNDDSKYSFLQTAYQYTSDSAHFDSLQSLLSEEKNIKSFKEFINQTKVKE